MEQLLNLPIWIPLLAVSVVILGIGFSLRLGKQTSTTSSSSSQPSIDSTTGHYLALKKGQIEPDQFVPISDQATIRQMMTEAIAGNRTRWNQLAASEKVVMVPAGTAVVLKKVTERLAEVEVDSTILKGKKLAGQKRWTVAAFVHKVV
ncbi:hypothetical protein H6G89_28970 [Oscillatoria sp. FACHB-1407]|uniref:hypothetical protein n=1 Tax=Oscillatoria sp. FACHB-1407 TaxID=2692847 RepID=UPI0016858D6D|nr:hypothetical protein [Oscillatoria sp. FACHB-1407]MBD2465043.1 hypothetical protein [Oscillatoria sp. FACHB-1407]